VSEDFDLGETDEFGEWFEIDIDEEEAEPTSVAKPEVTPDEILSYLRLDPKVTSEKRVEPVAKDRPAQPPQELGSVIDNPPTRSSNGSRSTASGSATRQGTQHFIGIDFGTCNSSAAWFNPRTGQAESLLNAEGDNKTPSVVYFGPKNEIVVGKHAEEQLESPAGRKRVLSAVKPDNKRQRKNNESESYGKKNRQ
jgi:Hsp70 protein